MQIGQEVVLKTGGVGIVRAIEGDMLVLEVEYSYLVEVHIDLVVEVL